MPLDSQTQYPSKRSYVLKLHRDARPDQGLIMGTLDNMYSGQHCVFQSLQELIACLSSEMNIANSSYVTPPPTNPFTTD